MLISRYNRTEAVLSTTSTGEIVSLKVYERSKLDRKFLL